MRTNNNQEKAIDQVLIHMLQNIDPETLNQISKTLRKYQETTEARPAFFSVDEFAALYATIKVPDRERLTRGKTGALRLEALVRKIEASDQPSFYKVLFRRPLTKALAGYRKLRSQPAPTLLNLTLERAGAYEPKDTKSLVLTNFIRAYINAGGATNELKGAVMSLDRPSKSLDWGLYSEAILRTLYERMPVDTNAEAVLKDAVNDVEAIKSLNPLSICDCKQLITEHVKAGGRLCPTVPRGKDPSVYLLPTRDVRLPNFRGVAALEIFCPKDMHVTFKPSHRRGDGHIYALSSQSAGVLLSALQPV